MVHRETDFRRSRSGRSRRRRIAILGAALLTFVLGASPPGGSVATAAVDEAPRSTTPSEPERSPTKERMVFDAVLLRPLQLVQVVASAIVFVPAYPVGWLFESEDEVFEVCIQEPVDRALRRPLGEL